MLSSTKPIVGFHRDLRLAARSAVQAWTVLRQFRQSGGRSQCRRSREENGWPAASLPLRSVSALRLLRGKRVIVSGSLAGKVSSNSLVNCRSISLLSRSLSDSSVIACTPFTPSAAQGRMEGSDQESSKPSTYAASPAAPFACDEVASSSRAGSSIRNRKYCGERPRSFEADQLDWILRMRLPVQG